MKAAGGTHRTNLRLDIGGITVSALTAFIVLLMTIVNPAMKIGTYGMMDSNFWRWNGLLPFAVIIVAALCAGIYFLGRYYFQDRQAQMTRRPMAPISFFKTTFSF